VLGRASVVGWGLGAVCAVLGWLWGGSLSACIWPVCTFIRGEPAGCRLIATHNSSAVVRRSATGGSMLGTLPLDLAARNPAARNPAARNPAARNFAARNPAARNPAARNPAARNPAARNPAARPRRTQPSRSEPSRSTSPLATQPLATLPLDLAARNPAARNPAARNPAARNFAARNPAARTRRSNSPLTASSIPLVAQISRQSTARPVLHVPHSNVRIRWLLLLTMLSCIMRKR
jgi:hypothetical protein